MSYCSKVGPLTGDDNPDPQLELAPEREKPRASSWLSPVAACAIAAWIACGAAFFSFSDRSADGEGAAALQSGGHDKVSVEQRAQIDGRFAGYTARLEMLAVADPKVRENFLASPYLEPELKQQLLTEMDKGERDLAVITLWDNFDQDGDVVSIQSGGVTLTVPLAHAPTKIFLPYKRGAALSITGVRDGGGGITAAVETTAGAVPLPVLSVGQTIVLPLM